MLSMFFFLLLSPSCMPVGVLRMSIFATLIMPNEYTYANFMLFKKKSRLSWILRPHNGYMRSDDTTLHVFFWARGPSCYYVKQGVPYY